jgi:hypothetical protein
VSADRATSNGGYAWLRPAVGDDAAGAKWGHPSGLQVGLHPLQGPRGLVRIYAPYLGLTADQMINFIAVEPIVKGSPERGYSELEASSLDGAPGKLMWTIRGTTTDGSGAARGVVEHADGYETLRLYVGIEPFANGADVSLAITFRSDRPNEVTLAAHAAADSASLSAVVLSATMGNFARLRRLELAHRTVTPQDLWPEFSGDHFTDHATFELPELPRNAAGDVQVSAYPDGSDPDAAMFEPGTAEHWRYSGLPTEQTWIAHNPDARLVLKVNARRTYWASTSPIPGGPSFENFELIEPFVDGREFTFRVSRLAP